MNLRSQMIIIQIEDRSTCGGKKQDSHIAVLGRLIWSLATGSMFTVWSASLKPPTARNLSQKTWHLEEDRTLIITARHMHTKMTVSYWDRWTCTYNVECTAYKCLIFCLRHSLFEHRNKKYVLYHLKKLAVQKFQGRSEAWKMDIKSDPLICFFKNK